MEMRRINIIFPVLILILISLFAGCEGDNMNKNNNEFSDVNRPVQLPVEYLEYVNNTGSSDDLVANEYALSDLVGYFEPIGKHYGGEGFFVYTSGVSIDEVNKVFRIECIRQEISESSRDYYFSVFKVKDGGRYYVEWSPSTSGYIASAAVYINRLKSINDFDSLKSGESTLKDVIDIDPSTQYMPFYSSKSFSYSLLNDGTLLEINYVPGPPNLIKSINTVESGLSFLSAIYKYDMLLDN